MDSSGYIMTRASQGMIWLRIQVSVIATFKMIYLNHLINEGDKTMSRNVCPESFWRISNCVRENVWLNYAKAEANNIEEEWELSIIDYQLWLMSMTGLLSAFGTKLMDPFRNMVSILVKLRTDMYKRRWKMHIHFFLYEKYDGIIFCVNFITCCFQIY